MKNRKKRLDSTLLISAFVISLLLFVTGIFVGYSFNKEELGYIEQTMLKTRRDVNNFQLQFLFLDVLGDNATCPFLTNTLSSINEEYYNIGSRLSSYDSENKIMDYDEYLNMKREYSRLSISYWLLVQKLRKSCRMNASTIIYFYSNECTKCDDQGFILTYLKNKLGNRLLVFALDTDLNEPSINVLKTFYNITQYPSLIIDGTPHEGFYPKDKLEAMLHVNEQ